MKLGIDFWSLYLQGWNIFEFLDYAHRLQVDVMHVGVQTTDWHIFESLEPAYLQRVRARADELGVALETGGCAISPTSTAFAQQGTCITPPAECAEANMAIAIADVSQLLRIAHAVGSPLVRCYLGHGGDRHSALPLAAHIESMLAVLEQVRPLALELGVKLAIENHGDLEARELKAVIEQAGPDIAGVCLDTGNPPFMGECPFLTLEMLAPYVITTHVRDTALWAHPRGAVAQWVALGEGSVGIERWLERLQTLCPSVTVNIENLTGSPPRVVNYLEPDFWRDYPERPAVDFARFLALVRQGQPSMGAMLLPPQGVELPPEYRPALVAQQRFDLERSICYCRETLGLGEK